MFVKHHKIQTVQGTHTSETWFGTAPVWETFFVDAEHVHPALVLEYVALVPVVKRVVPATVRMIPQVQTVTQISQNPRSRTSRKLLQVLRSTSNPLPQRMLRQHRGRLRRRLPSSRRRCKRRLLHPLPSESAPPKFGTALALEARPVVMQCDPVPLWKEKCAQNFYMSLL